MISLGVITGDLVGSRTIEKKKRQQLYADLKVFLQWLEKKKLIAGFELFRGDSFQCLVPKKWCTLRVALLLRAFIRAYQMEESTVKKNVGSQGKGYQGASQDMRLAVGIGAVDFYDAKNLAHSDGEAFRLSGEELDRLKKAPFRMMIRTSKETFNASMEPSMLLLDALIQKWTTNQAEIVGYKLQDMKEETIGQKLKISQSAVNQRTRNAQWYAIDKLILYFEQEIKTWE
jgi:hypothetical protein